MPHEPESPMLYGSTRVGWPHQSQMAKVTYDEVPLLPQACIGPNMRKPIILPRVLWFRTDDPGYDRAGQVP